MRPGMLPNRCFWHVHSKAGVACVFRIGGCGEHMDIASPSELQTALHRAKAQQATVRTIDFNVEAALAQDGGASQGTAPGRQTLRKAIGALLHAHAAADVVLVRLTLPSPTTAATGKRGRGAAVAAREAREAVARASRRLAGAVQTFQSVCPELTDRSKRKKRECTNVC